MSASLSMEKKNGHVCPHQISFILDNWFRRLVQHPKKIAGEYIREGDTVIDVGCGPGYFSIDLAKMVGETGKVAAVDIQQTMLSKVRKKALRHGVSQRMIYHQCGAGRVGLNQKADFILAYYMIHETPDPETFLAELGRMLKPGGKILVVEPKMHVDQAAFDTMVANAMSIGLKILEYPKGKGGRSVLLGI